MVTTLTLSPVARPRRIPPVPEPWQAPPPVVPPAPPPAPTLLGTLPLSHPAGQLRAAHPLLSAAVHGVLLATAVVASRAVPAAARALSDTTLVALFQDVSGVTRRAAAPDRAQARVGGGGEGAGAGVLVVVNPPPKGFQTIDLLDGIPKDIPPVDLGARPFDPNDFSGRGVEGGVAGGVVGGTGEVPDRPWVLAGTEGGVEGGGGGVFTTEAVEEPAAILVQQAPRYPPAYEAAGIAGYAVLQFVVDSTGRVEPATVTVLEATHAPFGEAAARAIVQSRFRPGRYHGEPVRQLVRQRVRFEVLP